MDLPKTEDRTETAVVLTLLHSERPKLYTILAFLSVIGLTYVTCSDILSLIEV